jgi:hypothetical protein
VIPPGCSSGEKEHRLRGLRGLLITSYDLIKAALQLPGVLQVEVKPFRKNRVGFPVTGDDAKAIFMLIPINFCP